MADVRHALNTSLLDTVAASPEAVLARLRSARAGLSNEEAAARLQRHGLNQLPKQQGPHLARKLLDQMIHFFALMLWAAAALCFVGEMPQLGVAIIVVIVVNGIFSFVQEYRAERAGQALAALVPDTATVRRAGRKRTIAASELVPGDIVLLKEGDRISADARVLRSSELKIDLSTLTGESEPVRRTSAVPAETPADALQASNVVFAGTFVTSGSATALVIATGPATRLGSISTLTRQIIDRPTPLRKQLNSSVRLIAAVAVATGLVFFGVAFSLGTPIHDSLLFSIGVIVALVPEGLLPTLSLSLAMSATRMAKRGALVRRLESVETLGSTTVICTDKTGTVTRNEMTARDVVLSGQRFHTTSSGYEPGGTILTAAGRPLNDADSADLRPLLLAAALCGDTRIESNNGRWRCVGDPTEGALLVLARKGGVERLDLERRMPRLREFPFESARQRMSTVHHLPSGAFAVVSKGSPEAILPLCGALENGAELDEAARAGIMAEVDALAHRGLRVLAFARRELTGTLPETAAEAEVGMVFLGLVGMADPVRPEVPDAIHKARAAGIRIVMMTGDHPATALAVAREAGITATRAVLGCDLPETDAELGRLLAGEPPVLARLAPEDKLRIARVLQDLGEVVAMTGDGVNDAPALRQADIGVAMGKGGTDVAREAADLVLLDDNFAHIVESVEEGRAAFDNIKRFLTYHLTDNIAELAPFVVWAISGGKIALMISVLQVLALDIGTDLLPALALGAERADPSVMGRPPRSRNARLLDRHLLGRAFGFVGPIEALLSMAMLPLGAWLFFDWPHTPLPTQDPELATLSTLVFAAIVVMQMANAFECRSNPASLFTIGTFSNRLLLAAVGIELLMLLVFVYLPPIAEVLGQRALTSVQWLPVLATPWLLVAAEETRKAVVRWLRRRADDAVS